MLVSTLLRPCGFAALAAFLCPASGTYAQCDSQLAWHSWGQQELVRERNNIVYIAHAGHIEIENVANPANPISLGRVTVAGDPQDLHLGGSYLYAAMGIGGLYIIDVSTPSAPTIASHISTIVASDVAVSSGLAFVVADGDLRIYDVANPAAPVFKSTYNPSFSASTESLASSGTTAYLLGTLGDVEAIDATNPLLPVLLDTFATAGSIGEQLALRGNTLAVAGWDTLDLINITNPAAMTLYSSILNTGVNRYVAFDVDGATTLIHFEYDTGDIRTYDVTNPAVPIFRDTLVQDFSPTDLVASNSVMYQIRLGDIEIYDYSVPTAPVLAGTLPEPPARPSNIVVVNPYVLVSDDDELLAIDVTTPTALPNPVSVFTTSVDEVGDMKLAGNRLYLASVDTFDGGLIEVLNVSAPLTPTLLGQYALTDGDPVAITVNGNAVYIVDDTSTLRIFDASDPALIQPAGTVALPIFVTSYDWNSLVTFSHYVAYAEDEAVVIIDVDNPTLPVVVHTLTPETIYGLNGFAMRGDVAFIAQDHDFSDDTVETFSLTNPTSPVLLDSITSPNGANSINLIDSLLFIDAVGNECNVVDCADPANLAYIESVVIGRNLGEAARRANTIWGVDDFEGFTGFTLGDYPRITGFPQDAPLCPASTLATFTVTVGNNAGVTYQWKRGGVNIVDGPGAGGATFAGATTPTLSITNPSLFQFGDYACEVTKACGSTTTAPARLFLAIPASFTQHPQSQSVCRSESVTFGVTGLATFPLTYQWQYESPVGSGIYINLTNVTQPRFTVNGATDRFMTIAAVAGETIPNALATNYRCIVTNICGSSTSNPGLLTLTDECCDSIDFNNDTSFFDPQDIDAFLSVYSEGPCIPDTATCNDIDFNNDGSVFDPCDIDSFLLVFSEGPCTLCGV